MTVGEYKSCNINIQYREKKVLINGLSTSTSQYKYVKFKLMEIYSYLKNIDIHCTYSSFT